MAFCHADARSRCFRCGRRRGPHDGLHRATARRGRYYHQRGNNDRDWQCVLADDRRVGPGKLIYHPRSSCTRLVSPWNGSAGHRVLHRARHAFGSAYL